jgi:hypothetical protein
MSGENEEQYPQKAGADAAGAAVGNAVDERDLADGDIVEKHPRDTGVGNRPVKGAWIVACIFFFLALSVLLLYALWQFWPPSLAPNQTGSPSSTVRFFGLTMQISREKNFLVIVAIAGALGAMGYVMRSFYRYAGERYLLWSWVPAYFLAPMLGAVLGTIVYVLLRGGLITSSGISQGDPFGFAAIAGLSGLFTSEMFGKLKQIFEAALTPGESGGESLAKAVKETLAPKGG